MYKRNVLSRFDCESLIHMAELLGFEKAKVNSHGVQKDMPEVRNNYRLFFTNHILADSLSKTLNENVDSYFRIYKYESGQYFKTHKDGEVIKNGKHSTKTMLIYLNNCKDAGTIIMPYGKSQEWAYEDYECEEGACLVFDQNTWHCGKEIKEGVKYVLRADIFED